MSCPDCFTGTVHDHEKPQGSFQDLYGYRTYVAGLGATTTSPSTIIYLPDAFGLRLVNNKILADRYANETGCRVLIPDIIPGGGADVQLMAFLEIIVRPTGYNPIAWFNRAFYFVRAMIKFIPFLIKAGAPKVYPSILKYARAVKADLPAGGKLGVGGFCWGGYGATRLCAENATEGGSTNLIDAAFAAHPSFLKTPDMIVDAISHKVPYSCAVAETDNMFNAKAAEQTEAVLREKVGAAEPNNYEFVIHKGCSHGFAVRANPDHKLESQGLEDAARQGISWFNRFLK